MMLIDHLKQKEKEKLLNQQRKLNSTYQMHSELERNKMLVNMSIERDNLNHNELRVRDKMRHSLNVTKNRKLGSLKKTLEAYVKHED
jgi:hypothetical protein